MQVRELFFEPQHSDENLEWLCLPVTPTSGGRESLRAQWPSSLAEPTSVRLREKIQSQGDKVEGEYDTWNCSGLRKPMHGYINLQAHENTYMSTQHRSEEHLF